MSLDCKLREVVDTFVEQRRDYFEQWIFDQPIVIGPKREAKLQRLQKCMYKLICEFVINYDQYSDLMPVSNETRRVIDIFNLRPYTPGTYRTDFVYDENNQERIIEITCRFALNSLFETAIFDTFAVRYAQEYMPNLVLDRRYDLLFPYMESMYAQSDQIIVLKGSDLRNASRLFVGLFENAGKEVKEVQYTDLHQYKTELKNSWVISELTLSEIESLDSEIITILSESNLINDFRTVFLIHDKRFFTVLGEERLLAACLSDEEIDFFSNYFIPAVSVKENPNILSEVKANKDQWIIKHRALGKSKSIYAGPVMTNEEWTAVIESEEISECMVQRWIPQRTFKGMLKGVEHTDFVTGTLLFINDHYFGHGPFRTSSHPVTNVVDDRKISALTLLQDQMVTEEEAFLILD